MRRIDSATEPVRRADQEVALARLYVLRAMAAAAIVGLFSTVTTVFVHEPTDRGMIKAMLAGLWLLAFVTIRYPLKMLPLFLFEFVWKTIWLLAFGLPQWWSGVGSPTLNRDLLQIGLFPVVVGLVMPWGYVWRHYFIEASERWS